MISIPRLTISFSLSKVEYEFWGERFSYSTPAMFLLAFIVGIIGGTYGIGGGAILVHFAAIIVEVRVHHAERLEDVGCGVLLKLHARNFLHDLPEQRI